MPEICPTALKGLKTSQELYFVTIVRTQEEQEVTTDSQTLVNFLEEVVLLKSPESDQQ